MSSSSFQFLMFCLLLSQYLPTGESQPASTHNTRVQFLKSFKSRRILQEGSCQAESGKDWYGGDLIDTPFTLSSPQQCCDRCKETSGCVGWLFRRNFNHCYLKKELRNDQPCSDCVRGRIDEDAPVVSDFQGSCNSQTGLDYSGGDLYNTPFNINDPGVCCEYCNSDPACKAWIWRGRFNHCWLKNVVNDPSECEDCTGGVLDEPVTVDVPEPLDFVERCRSDGERVAVAVAAGACARLENTCPPAADLVDLLEDDSVDAPRQESDVIRANVALSEDAFDQALRESCVAVFEETCKSAAREKAAIHFQECASILANGPEFAARRCGDINQALRVFNDAVEPLCEFDSSIEEIQT